MTFCSKVLGRIIFDGCVVLLLFFRPARPLIFFGERFIIFRQFFISDRVYNVMANKHCSAFHMCIL